MALPHFSELRERARRSLNTAQNPKKVILLHTGATMLLSLLLILVDYLLEQQIGTTGGLSGIGTRSILETARSVLQLISGIVIPFWQMGYLYYTLKVAQGNDVGYAGLLQGFHRFGAVLRLKLLMAGIVFLVMMASSYLSSSIFMLTPWSEPLLQSLIPMFSGEPDTEAMMEIYESIPLSAVAPMMVIFLISFVALIIPVLYRYRMAELWLLDHPNHGAFAAVRNSRRMMRGNCIAVFKIDLHFWWFFALELLIGLIGYADLLLPQLGISLPFDQKAAYFAFFGAYLLLQMALYVWRQNEVSVTYAQVYEALKPSEEPEQPQLDAT